MDIPLPVLKTPPGKVAVMMTPPEEINGFLIPPRVQRPLSLGVVISEPSAAVIQGQLIQTPDPATKVWVHKDDGMVVQDKALCEGQIRIYGHFTQVKGEPVLCNWFDSVLLDMTNEEAFGDKVWIKHNREDRTESGIWLPEKTATQGAYGTVVAAGPLCVDVKKGDVVCYDPRAIITEFEDFVILGFAGVCFVKEVANV